MDPLSSKRTSRKRMTSFAVILSALGVLLSSGTTSSMPLCNGFYQALPCYYRAEPNPLGQRLMYVQYMAPSQGRVRAANDGVSTFVAADAIGPNTGVGAGAFVNEPKRDLLYDPVENHSIESDQSGGQGAVSIAQSYPTAVEAAAEDVVNHPQPEANAYPSAVPEEPAYYEANTIANEFDNDRKGKGPSSFYGSSDETTHPGYDSVEHQDATQATQSPYTVTTQTVAPQPAIASSPLPVVAATYIPPRKKIRVELETPTDESDENSYEEPVNTKIASRRPPPQQRPPANRPPQQPQQLPSGSYFATHFGSTSGGAIAIANSYSTGEGGSATSHATAYGSPANGRTLARKRV